MRRELTKVERTVVEYLQHGPKSPGDVRRLLSSMPVGEMHCLLHNLFTDNVIRWSQDEFHMWETTWTMEETLQGWKEC